MQLFDHLLQKHAFLAADSVLVILNKQLLNILFQQFTTAFQYSLTHKIKSLLDRFFELAGKFFIIIKRYEKY